MRANSTTSVNPITPADPQARATATSPEPLARPTLLPGLRRLWRGRRSLQLGVDPARAVVLELSDPAVARLLDLLDGTRSERSVLTDAGRYGIGEPDARALLDVLRRAGLVVGARALLPHNLTDPARRRLRAEAAALALRGTDGPATPAQILRRRTAARVMVAGRGRLAGTVALALAQAGVGHVAPAIDGPVDPGDPIANTAPANTVPANTAPANVGNARPPSAAESGGASAAVARAIALVAPGTRTEAIRRRDTTFVVHVGATGPATLTAAAHARRRVAHLAVEVRDGRAIIGPLVPPAGSPCLNCLDLHRQDRDPLWPDLAAQLATGPVADEPCAAATVMTAAGLAAGEVLGWLDGVSPTTVGASIEITVPGALRRRSWPPHPRCHCIRSRRK